MSNNYDYIIVGQGIGGTLVDFFLQKEGKKVLLIDNNHHQAASRIAAGVINPITGRKYVKSWRIEEFLPVAKETYQQFDALLVGVYHHEKFIYRGLYSIEDENTWAARKTEPISSQYILPANDENQFSDHVNGIQAYGVLQGGMQCNLPGIIAAYKEKLLADGRLVLDKFEYDLLEIREDEVSYKEYTASNIIFAEGYQSKFNPWFGELPYRPAKGEALIIKIEGTPFVDILRHKLFISPIDEEHYWVGANYFWDTDDDSPTEKERTRLVEVLDKILKDKYTIVDHIAGIRPCVRSRRPMLGRHAEHKNLILFNGLGTKGASLGPFWAKHLVEHLVRGNEIDGIVRI